MLFGRTVVLDCLLAHIGQLTSDCMHPCQMTSIFLFWLALVHYIIMLFSRSVGSESLIYACCTACLALRAPLSDDFILLFRLGRANINWLDNPVVAISYMNQCSIVSIANGICLLGSVIALELPLKWLLVACIPKYSFEVGYLFFYALLA